jgi:tRNA-splicing ligase RtcB
MNEWLERLGVTLIGADLDESPMSYRRLLDVLSHHVGSIRVMHTLKPFVVLMAGNEDDPWKD